MTTTEQAPAQAGITELLEQFESILCRNARIAGVESVSGYTDYVEDLEAERVARKNLRDALSALVSRLAELERDREKAAVTIEDFEKYANLYYNSLLSYGTDTPARFIEFRTQLIERLAASTPEGPRHE